MDDIATDQQTTPQVPIPNNEPIKTKRPVPFVLLTLTAAVLVTWGIFFARNMMPTPPTAATNTTRALKPLFLTLNSPNGHVNVANGEVLVNGYTLPNTAVVAFSDSDDVSLYSDAQGKFETSLLVDPNGGLLQVTAYSETGDEKSQTVALRSSTEVLGKSDAPGKVKKSENAPQNTSNPGLGNRPDKEDNSNIPEPTSKPIRSPSDVSSPQAKNFLSNQIPTSPPAKLGAAKLKDVLTLESSPSASHALKKMEAATASAGATLKRHAIMGVITALSDGVITIRHQTQIDRTNTIFYNAGTVVTMKGVDSASPTNLTIGMRISAVGIPTDEGLLASRIHVIPGKATGVFRRFPVASGSGTLASPSATPEASPSPTVTETPTEVPTPTETPVP